MDMFKLLPTLFVFSLLIIPNQIETPENLDGRYNLISSHSDKAMDINGDGQLSNDFME